MIFFPPFLFLFLQLNLKKRKGNRLNCVVSGGGEEEDAWLGRMKCIPLYLRLWLLYHIAQTAEPCAARRWNGRTGASWNLYYTSNRGEKGEKRSVGGAVTLLPAVRAESADSSAVATRDQKCLFIFYVYILKEIELGERSPPDCLSSFNRKEKRNVNKH